MPYFCRHFVRQWFIGVAAVLAAVANAVAFGAEAPGDSTDGALDFSGCFPADRIRTIALVMPASIQGKSQFD